MVYDPQKHHRRSIRLPHWDYSWGWWYYVTINLKDRRCDFGCVQNDVVVLSDLGKAASDCWIEIPNHHKGVELDDFVIMPNHVHGILILNDIRKDVQLNVLTTERDELNAPSKDVEEMRANGSDDATKFRLFASKKEAMAVLSPKKGSLSVVMRTFKAAVTTWARANHHETFAWQGRYHDHIIRNDADLHRIREYIANNPLRWALDEENPSNVKNAVGVR